MSTLRFRVAEPKPTIATIARLRQVTNLSIAEIRERAALGHPVIELSSFENTWQEDRLKLVMLANEIEARTLPLTVAESFQDGTEHTVDLEILQNLIAHFRALELETQRHTMLELGEIDDASQFEPSDDDWTGGPKAS